MKTRVALSTSLFPLTLLFPLSSLALCAKLDISQLFSQTDNANATPCDYSNPKTDRMRCRESTSFLILLLFLFVAFVSFSFHDKPLTIYFLDLDFYELERKQDTANHHLQVAAIIPALYLLQSSFTRPL